jgi:hypothetical protein
MFENEEHKTFEIARDLLPRLRDDMKQQLETLLNRADAGEKVEIEIIDLLSQNEPIRKWMKLRMSGKDGSRFPFSLPGDPGVISNSSIWICPRFDCNYNLPVLQAGESAPHCKIHSATAMIISTEKNR